MSILSCNKNVSEPFTFQREGNYRSLLIGLPLSTSKGLPFISDYITFVTGMTIAEFSIKKVYANNNYAYRNEEDVVIVETTTTLSTSYLISDTKNGKIRYYYTATSELNLAEGIYYFYFKDNFNNEFRTELFNVTESKLEVQVDYNDDYSYDYN